MTDALEFVMGALFSRWSGIPSHNLPPIAALFKKRLVFVTGKGGVGKTTVALALGLAAARRGLRTIVCEVAHQERFSRLLGREGVGYEETEIAENLNAISLDQQHTLEEWVTYQLPSKTLAGMLYRNGIFQHLTSAAPGIKELVTIGKIWELTLDDRKVRKGHRYDVVIVDAAATGHGVGFLQTPRTFAGIARVGPMHQQARTLDAFVTDPKRTGVAIVAIPEEMPVNETASLERDLTEEVGVPVDRIFLNGLYPERFSADEVERLEDVIGPRGTANGDAPVRAACRSAVRQARRAAAQRAQLARLQRLTSAPLTTLPFLFDPELGVEQVAELSEAIA
jgi:anion-transporting  ArsA/GET3 family ATPase